MFVSDRMTRDVMTIGENDTIRRAAELLAERHIHQLPVVRPAPGGPGLLGIVTDRDVRSVPPADRDQPVSRIMTARPLTCAPGEPLEEALLLLHRHRFGSLPVVVPTAQADRQGEPLPRLVGIITHTDILGALIDMLGIAEPGTRLEVEVPEGSVAHIGAAVDAVVKSRTRVISLIFSGRPGKRGHRLYLRLSTIDPRNAIDALTEAGFSIADPFCPLR